MNRRKPSVGISFAAALLVCASATTGESATLVSLTGGIGGEVKSASGIVQMGAAVVLYNRYDRAIRQVLTDSKGNFLFDSLLPDQYSIRVSLSSFVPAFKRNIMVQPGVQSLLTINLAGILSSVELVSTGPAGGSLMAPDWKWVLRGAQATRPVLRFRELDRIKPHYASVFSETRGIVNVSAGDGTAIAGTSAQPDLGTAFALATSLFGSNLLQVSGNVGFASRTGLPTAGFRTTYKRTANRTPEITVTMRQISLPSRGGFGFGGATGDGGPALRTVSASALDEFNVTDNVRVEYGISAESVSLLNRLNTLSPFARMTVDLGGAGSIRLAFSSGGPAAELSVRSNDPTARENAELHQDLAVLGTLPLVSLRDGAAKVQRTQNLEIGYRKVAGSRTYSVGAYSEEVHNGALTMAGPNDLFNGDLLPDLGSKSSIFNIGNYSRWGYLASLSQAIGDKLEVSLAYGRGGALALDGRTLATNDADTLRSMVKIAEKNWATARVSGTAPVLGTHFAASYGYADYRSLMPAHNYMTQTFRPEPGLNISLRQPIPGFGFVPGRFEATAELRNLLEQGYLPVTTADGGVLLLTNAPRAVRGGLSFIF